MRKFLLIAYMIFFFVFTLYFFGKGEEFLSSDEMILIPGGEFVMGRPSGEGKVNENPSHTVYISDFYIDKYEVTNREYSEFLNSQENFDIGHWINIVDERSGIEMSDDFYKAKEGRENYPAAGITWYGADAYVKWKGMRLPAEAEWEKAARGSDERIYPWGLEWDPLKCANSCEGGSGVIMPVGTFLEGASPYGIMDMSGSVWEWCSDWYDSQYYSESPYKNPSGPAEGSYKVMRGGSWFYSTPSKFTCTMRNGRDLKCKFFNIGFRCAK